MDYSIALKNLQGLLDTAVKKGVFENAATVVTLQQNLAQVAAGLQEKETKQPE